MTIVEIYFSTRRSTTIDIATINNNINIFLFVFSFLTMIVSDLIVFKRDNIFNYFAKIYFKNRFRMSSSHDDFHHVCDFIVIFVFNEISFIFKKINISDELQCFS